MWYKSIGTDIDLSIKKVPIPNSIQPSKVCINEIPHVTTHHNVKDNNLLNISIKV